MRSKADVCLGSHPINAGYEEQANLIPFFIHSVIIVGCPVAQDVSYISRSYV
jgi:hypothetical protein